MEKTKYQSVNLKGRHTLRRPKCRWEDSIKMDTIEKGCEGVKGMKLIQDKF
jgi:hypothetical protein